VGVSVCLGAGAGVSVGVDMGVGVGLGVVCGCVCVCVQVCVTHVYTGQTGHTYICIYIHTCMYIYIPAYIYTYVHIHKNESRPTHTQAVAVQKYVEDPLLLWGGVLGGYKFDMRVWAVVDMEYGVYLYRQV